MSQVFLVFLAVNEDIVKKCQSKLAEEGANALFIACWNVAGAPVSPKAITWNS